MEKQENSRYKQVKISVDPEIAKAFKKACEKGGVSMAAALSMLSWVVSGGIT